MDNMRIIGMNGAARIFTNFVEGKALEQIKLMMDEKITEGTQVRIMPDVHYGKGSTIGTTIMSNYKNGFKYISPQVVGVDIGCGITAIRLDIYNEVDLAKLDDIVKERVPSGHKVHQATNHSLDDLIDSLHTPLDFHVKNRVRQSIGTLGGGNHYIELAKDELGRHWLSVHTGSRNLGVQICNYHQEIASSNWKSFDSSSLIEQMKLEGRHSEIEDALEAAKRENEENKPLIPYLMDEQVSDYLHDMEIAQQYARDNRYEILGNILDGLEDEGLCDGDMVADMIDSPHNLVSKGIIRKGATSARKGERLLIPINMREGTLICTGKGNEDWNYSAPHGAGRKMSRTQAKREINIENYKEQMKSIYTTSVNESTLDEAPDAYKPLDNLLNNIGDTVDIVHHLLPVYNYKAH